MDSEPRKEGLKEKMEGLDLDKLLEESTPDSVDKGQDKDKVDLEGEDDKPEWWEVGLMAGAKLRTAICGPQVFY
jgi:hypothetical protein